MKHHVGLTQERWCKMSIFEQLANIGMEVERTVNWRNVGNKEYSEMAFERALELFYLTKADQKNRGSRLKEVCRAHEVFVDFIIGENQYQSSDKLWQDYFCGFNYTAALERGR